MFTVIDVVPVARGSGRVYEHGWQSWSPAATYAVDATSFRPVSPAIDTMAYRPGRPAPADGFQAEGLLAVEPEDGAPIRVYAAPTPTSVPSIRASYVDGRLEVSADGRVEILTEPGPLPRALAAWADTFAAATSVTLQRSTPTGWCSWYQYYADVAESDIVENLDSIAAADMPVDVVQIDDGWQAGIGDWLDESDRFTSLAALAQRIRDHGRRPGIWLAPFLVGARSALAAAQPAWLISGDDSPVDGGYNWDQPLFALDPTHPAAIEYLREVLGTLRGYGFDYFKLDFLYAAALDGHRYDGSTPLVAYRAALALVREAVGDDAYLVGSGAPLLPSVGLVDAMRVSGDIAPTYAPADGDPSRPSQFGASLSTVARAFQHGRFWVNDSDCLLARPGVERREEWAALVERYGGLRVSSDRVAELDDWGLATTRRLLSSVPARLPFPLDGQG